MDALYKVLQDSGVPLSDMLIFLPSRRAVRVLENFLVDRAGHSIFLPRLVALGEGADENSEEDEESVDALSDTMRLALITKLLVADASIGNVVTALPVAHDLLRMQDYLENEGVDVTEINWMELVDDKYAAHFQHKAKLLNILSEAQKLVTSNKPTKTQIRNSDIRAWIKSLDKYKLVVVCGSTASVPATADLMEAIAKIPNGRIILSGHIDGRHEDFILSTNPYNAEYKFLNRIGVSTQELVPIDVGKSCINFFNCAFGNDTDIPQEFTDLSHCHLINCERESEEAAVVAEIAAQAVEKSKTVLVITPDAAGNQRIAAEFKARGLRADFSGAIPGTRTLLGRAILNKFDEWIENSDTSFFDNVYSSCGYDLIRTLVSIIDDYELEFEPKFLLDESDSIQIWQALKELSETVPTLARLERTVLTMKERAKEERGEVSFMRDAKGYVVKPRYDLVSSHTARRSGITNLYLTGLFDSFQMMSVSGHKDEKTFNEYIKLSSDEIADAIAKKLAERNKNKSSNEGLF